MRVRYDGLLILNNVFHPAHLLRGFFFEGKIVKKSRFHVLWVLFAIGSNAAYSDDTPDAVLVSNSRVAVTRSDFDAEITRVPEDKRFEFLASRERIGRVMQSLLIQKTLAAQALDAGLDKEPQTRKQAELAVSRVLSTAMMEHSMRAAKVPDMELRAKEIYKINRERFVEKKTVRASHVLIDTKSRSRDEALARAREVNKLAMGGGDFSELAVKFSDDTSVQGNKGDLSYFASDKMEKAFSDAAFAMKKDEISEPVETSFGFHIIKITDVKEGGQQPYDSVKQKLIEELKAEYLSDLRNQATGAITADKDMKVNEDEVQKIQTHITSVAAESPKQEP